MAWKRGWKKWDWPAEDPKEVKKLKEQVEQLKKDVARSGASSSAGSLGEDTASADSNLSKKDLEERMTSLKKMKSMATTSEKEWIEDRITATARLLHSLKPCWVPYVIKPEARQQSNFAYQKSKSIGWTTPGPKPSKTKNQRFTLERECKLNR